MLVAEVEFAEWTHEGRLRAPSYLRLREDKAAADVRRERAPLPPVMKRGRRELRFSNLDKPFWPEDGITKGDLIAYYRDVAEVLVPHLRGRPFTMKRYPDGWQGKNFFQKNAPSHMPDWIERAPFPASTREGEKKIIDYALVNDELALLWMANMGCIDLHTWASRVDRPERPDWVMFDLDPSEGAGFEEVIEVARLVKQTLDLLELESFPKTSGSRGIHVLVPIARRHSFEEVREFAGIVGRRARAGASRPRDDRVGEGEADAACSSTRTRTARGGRTRRSTRSGRGRALPSRRRCAGTRSCPGSTRRRSRWTRCSTGSRATATCSRARSPASSRCKAALKSLR